MGHRVRAFLSTVIAVFLLIAIPSLINFSDTAIAHLNPTVASATFLTQLQGNQSSSVGFIPFNFEPLQNFIDTISNHSISNEVRDFASKIIYGLLWTLIFVIAWKLLNILHQKSFAKLSSLNWENYHLKIQHIELISSDRILGVASLGLKVVHIILNLCILYIYIPIILNLFPQTQTIADSIISYTVNVFQGVLMSLLAYLPKLITLLLIIATAFYISRLIRKVLTEIERGSLSLPGFYPEWVQPTYKLSLLLLTIFTIAIAYPFLPGGFESPAFRGIAIFGAVLGALGARESVSDIISGIVLIYSRSFLEGDRIIVKDIKGTVLAKTLLVTRIRTPKNVVVTIPNSSLRSSHIVNFSAAMREANTHLVLHASITLGYDLPWRTVHEVLQKAAEMTQNIIHEPAPFVLQTNMNDYHITYELNAYTDKPEVMERTYSSLYQNVQDCCREAQIEILSPSYLAVRDGNESTIPAN
jgi:small-conductance mechanosensitive channel